MKNIREIRMGPPKTWKTGAVVTTYPNPKLVFEGDEGGLDVVKETIQFVYSSTPTTNDLSDWCKKKREELPPILAVQFKPRENPALDNLFTPTGDRGAFDCFNKTFNNLFLVGCPWKTVVVDPATILQEMVLTSFAAVNAAKMEDAQKWAGAVGEKMKRLMATMFTLPCHVVIIMHTADKDIVDPVTRQVKETKTEPVLYGKVRNFIASLPSQFFYQDLMVVGGVPKVTVQTQADGRIKGVGARWPAGLPTKCGATFDAIYGDAVKRGETWQ